MGFEWNEEKINWFLDAGAYGDFHQRLARELAPYLAPEDSLCDLGCGLGFADMALAPHVASVTAVDAEPAVIASLAARAGQAGLCNLHAVCGDARALGQEFDVVFMSFFGCRPEELERFARMAKKRLIRVVNIENKGSLYPEKYRRTKKNLAADVERELAEAGYTFELLRRTFEFGQPLRSREAGLAYLRDLAPEAPGDELLAFLDGHARQTGREDFPLYLPNAKEVGIFIIETA